MKLSRRSFTAGLGAAGAASLLKPSMSLAARPDELNILCWEGYNTDDVLGPFRDLNPGATVRAESGTSDPDMINKLRAGEVNVWDLINLKDITDEAYVKDLRTEVEQLRVESREDLDAVTDLVFAKIGE